MPESSRRKGKSDLSQHLEARVELGSKHSRANEYKRALECYLDAFDRGHQVEDFRSTRLFFLLPLIEKLGKDYPPALDALRKRRDARERSIEGGVTEYRLVHEWMTLNRHLNDKEHELAFLERLREEGALDDELESEIICENIGTLLEQRDFALLGGQLNRCVWHLLLRIHTFVSERDFPYMSRKGVPRSHLQQDKQWTLERGVECYEIALGCRKPGAADKILSYLQLMGIDRRTYVKLLAAAKRTNQKSQRLKLLREAKKSLSARAYNGLADL